MEPRWRLGSLPSPTLGTHFLELEQLGRHSYRGNFSEQNGIVYTCKAGHIDTYHVRDAADWTAYLAAKTYKALSNRRTKFSFIDKDGSVCFVTLNYPDDWAGSSDAEKEDTIKAISIRLGQYLSYTLLTWHEIVTWFGYKSSGVFPEYPSAFSWEDSYSNVLGSRVGALALADSEHDYDEAVTTALEMELTRLSIQPAAVARQAAENVRGVWFEGELPFVVEVRKRNFDIGFDDGLVEPCIAEVEGRCRSLRAQPLPAPGLDFLSQYGLSVRFEIEPWCWEREKILDIVYAGKTTGLRLIEPARHFPAIIEYIRKQAQSRYGAEMVRPCGG